MKKKHLSIVAGVLCWLVLWAAGAQAGAFYENRFTISRFSFLRLANQTFTVDAAGPARLVITKETPNRNIQTGYLFLNGKLIFLHNFLNGPRPALEQEVTLKAQNRLQLFMLGAPNAAVSIAFFPAAPPAADPPAATLGATPATITPGDDVILTWSTSGADSVTILPDIGPVAPSGSVTIKPFQTTTYTLTADGPGGSAEAQATVAVSAKEAIRLTVDTPVAGDVITNGLATVKGSFHNGSGRETGITVNGVVALIHDGSFAASHVPLQPGPNTLTIQAVDSAGTRAEEQISLTADTSQPRIYVRPTAISGLAPFETDLAINAPAELHQSRVTVAGPAAAEVIRNALDHYTLILDTPGLYTATITAADAHNNTWTDTLVLQVLDQQKIDNMLRKNWGEMQAALAWGDIPTALSHYSPETRALHQEIFTALGDELPAVAGAMRGLELVAIENGFATYHLARNETHQGRNYEITYDVYFTCGRDGLWKIVRY